ncbi:hypothetical protein CPB86DRAFT_19212 [Serendipita vermifera]|nr:hypothetical protein CPB86DRAFT_19212 [Serendipita vermifera]
MPRFETPVNQYIVPVDPFAVTAVPCKPKRSSTTNILSTTTTTKRNRSNSSSALERLSAFTEATQRVKRRLRNAIAGAVGASVSKPKRKSRDAMNVDSVWNGWYDSIGCNLQPAADVLPPEANLPNFAPTINRYSVNMDAQSMSDVSMYDEERSAAPTPRATTPEPKTPIASPTKEVKAEKATKNPEPEEEGNDEEGEEDGSDEEEEAEPEKKRPASPVKITIKKGKQDDAASILSPMDEDQSDSETTPKAASPAPKVVASPSRTERKVTKRCSCESSKSKDKTPQLNNRTPSTDSSPPKTPPTKLTLITNFDLIQVRDEERVLTGNDNYLVASPEGLGLELEAKLKQLDLMDVIPPTALPAETGTAVAPFELTYVNSTQEEETEKQPAKPTLLSPIKLTEKKPTRKSSSRRGSINTNPPDIVCSPRRTAIIAGKKKSSKGNLNGAEDALEQELISPTTLLRAKIDALPSEQEDSFPIWGLWTYGRQSSPLARRTSQSSFQTIRAPGEPQ